MSKPQISPNNKFDRIVVLIDMDCFYCQVEELLNPDLKGKPIAVVQYNAWRGGGIIAVNYPARAKGVTRHMRGDEAKNQCPDIELVKVPNIREKADLSKYRNAGKQVAAVLQTFTQLLTRASVDEAYLDITEQVQNRLIEMNQGKFALQPNALKNTFAVGYENIGEYVQEISHRITQQADDDIELINVQEEDRKAYKKSDIKLLIASSIVSEIRAAVKEQTGFECSAGIAHNKILAKLVCGLNKPNKQTIIPLKSIPQLFSTLPIRKVQGLGGKFGEKVSEDLNIQFIGEITKFSKEELQKRFDEKNGQWLYNISRGIDLEAVTPRLVSKSIGCCKKFPGRNAIGAVSTLNHWLRELAKEIAERLEQDEVENNRRPKQMVVSFVQTINNADISSSRTITLSSLDEDKLVNDALDTIKKNTDKFIKSPDNPNVLNNPIKFLGLNVGKFENWDLKRGNTIQDMFRKKVGAIETEPVLDELKNDNETDEKVKSLSEKTDLIEGKEQYTNKLSFFANYNAKCKDEDTDNNNDDEKEEEEEEDKKEEDKEEVQDKENTFQDDMLLAELEANERTIESDTSSMPSTSSKQDYKQTYAEFYQSQLPIDLPKVQCNQCGKKVYEHEMQVHNDAHLAYQLSQEQRVEFQNQLKRSIPTVVPAAKKMKIQNKSQSSENKLSIQKFLVKTTQPDQKENIRENNEMKMCEECGQNILIAKLLEHSDYHAAKKLHDELLQEQRINNNNNSLQLISKAQNGSSKKTNGQKKKGPSNSTKNIASFFQND